MSSQEAKSDEVCLFFLIKMFSLKKHCIKLGLKTRICGIKKKRLKIVKEVLSTRVLPKNEQSKYFVSLKLIFEEMKVTNTLLEKRKKC